jgi:glycopeptide antibiotics resistance protein
LRRSIAKGLLAVYTLFMLTVTLLILGSDHTFVNLVPFRTMAHDWRVGGQSFVINFLGNIIAFMPFGILLPLARKNLTRGWQAVAWTGGFSLAIEVMQYLWAHRIADIDDVILNSLGGALGYLSLRLWQYGAFRQTVKN